MVDAAAVWDCSTCPDVAQTYYRIAGLIFQLETPEPLHQTEAFLPFIVQPQAADITVRFRPCGSLALPQGPERFRNLFYAAYDGTYGPTRIYFDPKEDGRIYGMRRICQDGSIEVTFREADYESFCYSNNSFFHVALEEVLLRFHGLILHAYLVDVDGTGILFTGPSGIGKSTQAELWAREKHARILNGDRVILRRTDEGWRAYGSPYAGSSGYWRNESTTPKAVVILDQSRENQIKRPAPRQCFQSIWTGLILNTWNPQFVNQASSMAQRLMEELPIYWFGCTPDASAVETLSRALRGR